MDSVVAAYPELPRTFYGPDNYIDLAKEIMRELEIPSCPEAWNPDKLQGRAAMSDWFRCYWLWKHPAEMWFDSDVLVLKRFDGWTQSGKPYIAYLHEGVVDICWTYGNNCPAFFEKLLRGYRARSRYGVLVNGFDGSSGYNIPREHFRHFGCTEDAYEDPDPHWWKMK
jgi:hypothetical protein